MKRRELFLLLTKNFFEKKYQYCVIHFMGTLLNLKNSVLNSCKRNCKCSYCRFKKWVKSSLLSVWSFIKEGITEPELIKPLGLIASAVILYVTGDLKCFFGTLALGLGLLNLYEYLRWR